MTILWPELGEWYRRPDSREPFRVVAIDDGLGTIDIQYFTGDIEELELAVWLELAPRQIEPPEDWTGPYDGELDDGFELHHLLLGPASDSLLSMIDDLD